MYIINERSGAIVNSDFVAEFYLMDISDSPLVSTRFPGEGKPVMLECYTTRKEAIDVKGREGADEPEVDGK